VTTGTRNERRVGRPYLPNRLNVKYCAWIFSSLVNDENGGTGFASRQDANSLSLSRAPVKQSRKGAARRIRAGVQAFGRMLPSPASGARASSPACPKITKF
jgi:hypothetical protein